MPNNESTKTWTEGDVLTWHRMEVILFPLVMVIGIVGNSLVLYIYNCRLHSTTDTMIKRMLAIIDLSSSIVVNSLLLYMMFNKNSLFYNETCVFTSCFAIWTLTSGSCVLVVIAVDRFMRLCLMRLTGVTTSLAQKLFAAFLLICALVNIPCLWIFGKSVRYYPDYQIKVSQCFFKIGKLKSVIFRLYFTFIATFFLGTFLALFILYFNIIQSLYRHSSNRKKLCTLNSRRPSNASVGTPQFSATSNIVVFVVITVVYFLTNFVFIVLVSLYFFKIDIQANTNSSLKIVYDVAKYGPMFSHIINPLIYSFISPTFRDEVCNLIVIMCS